jgi:phage recombination protein Bet
VRRTVAHDATPDELKLYLYDCARQGVHPLDKLIHFTKRKGKYTPITSIDFMRTRAADTGEYAGSDDATFAMLNVRENEAPLSATVTVWRLVQGQRCPFTATARWSEYKPEANDFMWQKMPHTMLAKCAEALALRKGFPRQLAGLYAKEEMDQAGEPQGYTVTAPAVRTSVAEAQSAADANGGAAALALMPAVPSDGLLRIRAVNKQKTKNTNVTKYVVVLSDGREVSTIKDQLATLAEQCCQDGDPVTVDTASSKWGENLTAIHRVEREIQMHDDGINPDDPLPF